MTTMTLDPARRWRIAAWSAAVALLLLPFVAMQLTREVNWTASDFAIFAVMLFVPAAAFDYLTRCSGGVAYRLGGGVALVTAFLLVWVNLAVGIIGSEDNAANLLFAVVLAVFGGGAAVSRLRAGGMAAALLATAVAQVAVAGIALLVGLDGGSVVQVRVLLIASIVFALLWLLSAALFWRAAAE